jgi:hypothetical protein
MQIRTPPSGRIGEPDSLLLDFGEYTDFGKEFYPHPDEQQLASMAKIAASGQVSGFSEIILVPDYRAVSFPTKPYLGRSELAAHSRPGYFSGPAIVLSSPAPVVFPLRHLKI